MKKESKFISSAFERKHLEEKFTYLYLTNSQYPSAYHFNQMSSAVREIIQNILAIVWHVRKKVKKHKEKMSHVTVCN